MQKQTEMQLIELNAIYRFPSITENNMLVSSLKLNMFITHMHATNHFKSKKLASIDMNNIPHISLESII